MKKLALVLMALMCATTVFANGSKETAAPAAQSKTTSNVPALKGPGNVTLKRLAGNASWDVNKDIICDVTKQSTGYDVEYYALPAENANEKLMMELASGKSYDVMSIGMDKWRTLMANGVLQPLNDLLDAYGKDILAGVPNPDAWKAVTDKDGKIYGIPRMYPYDSEVNDFMIARMDLIRAAGIDKVPTTIDEFYDMLVALKKYYGDQYIILAGPLKNASENSSTLSFPRTISSAFGIWNDWMVDDNGKVIYMTEHPKFKDMVTFFAKCANEGLFDPDWAANTTSSINEKFASGRAILVCANRTLAQQSIPVLEKNKGLTDDDFGFVSALFGEDGTCKYKTSTAISAVACIPKSSKNAADAINFINIGVEGTHFTYDADGSIKPINPIFADERGTSYYYLDATDSEAWKKQWPSRIRKSAAQWLAFNAATIKINNGHPEVFVISPFTFMPPADNYVKYNTTLSNNLNDFILQVMAGTRTVDDVTTFQKDWANNGGEDVRKELQDYLATR